MTQDEPKIRPSARAIIIAPDGRVLLFRVVDDRLPERFWICPGGGLEPGETHEQAITRELREETGIEDFELGPCAWLRTHTWWWPLTDEWITSVERYYIVHVPNDGVDTNGQEDYERDILAEYRWFTLEELRTHDERLVPADFAERVAPILCGELPGEAVLVGD